jgi:circadian clock protein KaiB
MSRRNSFKFRLYVAGDTPNSAHAVANLIAFCKAHLVNRYEIEIVDVLQQPKRALTDSIFMTPTLLTITPEPVRRIVGTLSQPEVLFQAFGLQCVAA